MLILQHVWRRWTKATRAAADAGPRLTVAEAWPLKVPHGLGAAVAGQIWRHEVRALEAAGFAPEQRAGVLTHDAWAHETPMHAANLHWRLGSDAAEISLSPPGETLRTPWPAHLSLSLLAVRSGHVVRIDWNGRFLASLAGSDRSYYYDWHTFWLTWADAPPADVFTAAQPRKHVDLRTRIY